ncbi:YvrJ family protein [Anaerosinus sp.]
MEQILTYTASYGFPMVVLAYLRLHIEGKLEQLQQRLEQAKNGNEKSTT